MPLDRIMDVLGSNTTPTLVLLGESNLRADVGPVRLNLSVGLSAKIYSNFFSQ